MKELGLRGNRSETTIPESGHNESKRLAWSFVEDRDEVGGRGAIRSKKKRRIRRRPLAGVHGISGSKSDPTLRRNGDLRLWLCTGLQGAAYGGMWGGPDGCASSLLDTAA